MTTLRVFDALGAGYDMRSDFLGPYPMSKVTGESWESVGGRLVGSLEFDGGEIVETQSFKWGKNSYNFRLMSMQFEDATGQNLVMFTGIGYKVDFFGDIRDGSDVSLRGDDRLIGNKYADVLFAGRGNDLLEGNGGNDRLYGGNNDDILKGQSGDDRMKGGSGNDELMGGSGSDKLNGSSGRDILKGGSGNDQLNGGSGTDILSGGGGADAFIFKAGHQDVSVTDFSDAKDVLDLQSYGFANIKAAKVFASNQGGDTVFDFGGGDVLVLENFHKSDLDSGDFIL